MTHLITIKRLPPHLYLMENRASSFAKIGILSSHDISNILLKYTFDSTNYQNNTSPYFSRFFDINDATAALMKEILHVAVLVCQMYLHFVFFVLVSDLSNFSLDLPVPNGCIRAYFVRKTSV